VRTALLARAARFEDSFSGSAPRVYLLQGFDLKSAGKQVHVPPGSQRVIALLALREGPITRAQLSASLWPDVDEPRARGSLRSAIWRLSEHGHAVLESDSMHVRLHPAVEVDARELELTCHRALSDPTRLGIRDVGVLIPSADLLPGWYEDWVIAERERLRQLRLYALEAVCDALIDAGNIGLAVDACLAAVFDEPLRESAHRLLIRAHACSGNLEEAQRHYRLFRRLLRDELGVEPSTQMQALVRHLRV
jgi:DNA-binding SARP family transcriptional activator